VPDIVRTKSSFRTFAIIRSPCSRSRTPREADTNRIRLQGFCRTLGQHRNNRPESAREQSWKEPSAWIISPSLFSTPSVERTWQLHATSISCMAYRMMRMSAARKIARMVEPPVVAYSSTYAPKRCHDAVAVLPLAGGMIWSAMREGVDNGRDAHAQRYISRQAGRVPA